MKNKFIYFRGMLGSIILFAPQAVAEIPELSISGFGDFFYEVQNASEQEIGADYSNYGINQAELDITSDLDKQVSVEAAVAYNADDSLFELGAFIIDFRIAGDEKSHFHNVNRIETAGIMAGQFDVPFGIDCYSYPSIDRPGVTAPLIVENTHDGWNDLGVQAYIETNRFNLVAYIANGIGYEQTCEVGLCSTPFTMTAKQALGGRIGLSLHENIEIGGSYAHVPGREVEPSLYQLETPNSMALLGGDLQITQGILNFKCEYIAQQIDVDQHEYSSKGGWLEIENELRTHTGFYAQGQVDLGKYFLVGRYGNYKRNFNGVDRDSRTTGTLGYIINDNCQLRMEYQANSGDQDDMAYLQAVAGF